MVSVVLLARRLLKGRMSCKRITIGSRATLPQPLGELSGMPPKNPSEKTTKMEGRISHMHQIMRKTWNDSDSIMAVIEENCFLAM